MRTSNLTQYILSEQAVTNHLQKYCEIVLDFPNVIEGIYSSYFLSCFNIELFEILVNIKYIFRLFLCFLFCLVYAQLFYQLHMLKF